MILDCFPKHIKGLRSVQQKFLLWFQENYNNYDVFVGVLPVGAGKSLIAVTAAEWLKRNGSTAAINVTTKMLQDQYSNEFQYLPVLKGAANYECVCLPGHNCESSAAAQGGKHCTPDKAGGLCTYLSYRAAASASPVAIFNLHSYSINKMYKSNLIIDEGHNVADHLIGRFGTNIWSIKAEQRKCPFPESFSNGEQFRNSIRISADESIRWLRKYLDEVTSEYNASLLLSSKNDKLLASLKEEVTTIISVIQGLKTSPDTYLILFKESEVKQKTAEFKQFYGKKMKHLYIKPLKVGRLAQTVLWPEESVSKILFLSATFGQQDIDDLGLSDKRVGIFQCESPIPAQNREFRVFPVASMAYRNRQESVPRIALACMKIAEKHADEKGVIHCTYDIAKEIRNISTHSKHEKRLMFHTQQDKQEVYEAFRKSKKPVILVASGMSEGIDLKGDAARWQIITMLIKGSIEDDVNYYQMINNPELYDWKCARTVMQTAGRNCRDPLDIGHTYIIDSEFFNFYVKTHTNRIKAGKPSMWADWFLDAIVWSDRVDRR